MPPAPANTSTPDWLRFLRDVGGLAAIRPLEPTRRVLLGLPTSELAPAAVAVGAVAMLASYRRHTPLDRPTGEMVGRGVSAFVNGVYQDTVLIASNDAQASVAGNIKMTTYADVIRRLPSDFRTDRRPRKVQTEGAILTAWATAGLGGANAARLHARCSATPVVVIGQHGRLSDDLDEVEKVWPSAKPFADVGHGLDRWFRHPVLVCDPRTAPEPWLGDVRPSVVVCDGAAAWRSPLRRTFPTAAHVLVTDRRSPAALDLVAEICAGHPTTLETGPAAPPGVEQWRIEELAASGELAVGDEDII